MTLRLSLESLLEIVSNSTYEKHGDPYEKRYSGFINEVFPNSEIFWRLFVVPATNRIELLVPYTDFRSGISSDIADICSINYSVFMKLCFAKEHLERVGLDEFPSSFDDFYANIATVFDLTEYLVLKIVLLDENAQIFIRKHAKEEFLELLDEWYDKQYEKAFLKFVRDGQSVMINDIEPNKKTIIEQYINDKELHRQYKNISGLIRSYRNNIVHNVRLGRIAAEKKRLVPRAEFLPKYKRWADLREPLENEEIFYEHFVETKEKTNEDLKKVAILLNSVWERLIEGLKDKYYKEDHVPFLEDYGIEITDGEHVLEFREYDSSINYSVPPSGANIYMPYMPSGEHAIPE